MSKVVKIPFELLDDILEKEIDITIDGERYWFITEDKSVHSENGVTKTVIFEHASLGHPCDYYAVDIFLTRYGHKDYSLEEDYNTGELYPVRKFEEVITTYIKEEIL